MLIGGDESYPSFMKVSPIDGSCNAIFSSTIKDSIHSRGLRMYILAELAMKVLRMGQKLKKKLFTGIELRT